MGRPVEKVELGFDLTDSGIGPYFRLDDPVWGVLDGSGNVLGGTIFFDVTDRVKSFSTGRGKSRQLDRYASGQAQVVFNNDDRAFDPTFESSPYYGQIIPRREIRITSGTALQYFGSIDDWNLDYAPNGSNLASASCSDGFRILANQVLPAGTATAQPSGERVNQVLDDVNWPLTNRDVITDGQQLGADVVEADTNALGYLQLIEQSEGGALFISKDGSVAFRSGSAAANSDAIVLADDGSGISYNNLKVVYGSELLYNNIVISSVITGGTAIATDETSQGVYGVQTLEQKDLLLATNGQIEDLASWYSTLYANPEFRFESLEVKLENLTEEQQDDVLSLELGDVVQIKFTPGNPPIGPAISKYAEVIKLDNAVGYDSHKVNLGFATLDVTFLVLDDLIFGKLDTSALGI